MQRSLVRLCEVYAEFPTQRIIPSKRILIKASEAKLVSSEFPNITISHSPNAQPPIKVPQRQIIRQFIYSTSLLHTIQKKHNLLRAHEILGVVFAENNRSLNRGNELLEIVRAYDAQVKCLLLDFHVQFILLA
jgi:hypothetical protein